MPEEKIVSFHKGNRLLRRSAVTNKTGLADMTIDRLEARGDFPARVRLGPNSVAWLEEEVEQWIEARLRARGPLPIPEPLRRTAERPQARALETGSDRATKGAS